MNIKKHIPNLITLLNLFSGCIALVYASEANFEMAFFFVCIGIFFDFFDGFFARFVFVFAVFGFGFGRFLGHRTHDLLHACKSSNQKPVASIENQVCIA